MPRKALNPDHSLSESPDRFPSSLPTVSFPPNLLFPISTRFVIPNRTPNARSIPQAAAAGGWRGRRRRERGSSALQEPRRDGAARRVAHGELAGAARRSHWRAPAELVSVRCLTVVLCWFFLGAGPEGQLGLLATHFASLHAGAAQEGLLPPFPPNLPLCLSFCSFDSLVCGFVDLIHASLAYVRIYMFPVLNCWFPSAVGFRR